MSDVRPVDSEEPVTPCSFYAPKNSDSCVIWNKRKCHSTNSSSPGRRSPIYNCRFVPIYSYALFSIKYFGMLCCASFKQNILFVLALMRCFTRKMYWAPCHLSVNQMKTNYGSANSQIVLLCINFWCAKYFITVLNDLFASNLNDSLIWLRNSTM